MSVDQIVSIVKDAIVSFSAVITAVSALGTVLVAFVGLSTWKKELKGKSRFELAKETLKAVYKVRDGFNYVRSRLFSYEWPQEALDSLGGIKEGYKYQAYSHAYNNRLKILESAIKDLEKKNFDTLVELGWENIDKFQKIREISQELRVHIIEDLARRRCTESNCSEKEYLSREHVREKNENAQSILFNTHSRPELDFFNQKIDEAIEEYDKWLRPYIR